MNTIKKISAILVVENGQAYLENTSEESLYQIKLLIRGFPITFKEKNNKIYVYIYVKETKEQMLANKIPLADNSRYLIAGNGLTKLD